MTLERRAFVQKSAYALAGLPFAQNALSHELFAKENPSATVHSNPELLTTLESKSLTRIAFGSCNDTSKNLSYWSLIERDTPDLWIWLGDNIYADYTTLAVREARYEQFKHYPAYARFRAKTPIIGIWDDHDYGRNNSNGSFWSKEESQNLFCNFMDIPKDDPLRLQDGIYRSFTFGPKGRKTKVILLDLRYNMNKDWTIKELLGAAQWNWLEDEILNTDADLLVIGSSLAVTSDVALFGLEGWTEYGLERQRLYNLLSQTQMPVVLLSGDRHFGELYRVVLPSGRVIHEAMSSGLTHSSPIGLPHPGRVGSTVTRKNYGLLEVDWSQGRAHVKMQIKSTETYGTLTEAVITS